MSDLIDRRAAIDGLSGHYIERINLNDWQAGWNAALDWLESVYLDGLPSAQPEDKCGECDAWNQYKNYTRPDIVYCKDCIYGHGEVWLSGNGSADLYGYCGRTQLRVLPYDYCSRPERRTDD